jgi:beta-N-acetylhexosaminidase
MGFKGVIVSDAMVMGGFRGWYDSPLESEIESFKAGVDVLLWPSYAFMDTLEARINRGIIPMERLDDAVSRVWALKERFQILANNRQLIRDRSLNEKQFALNTSKSICERAITLIRDRNNALPLNPAVDKKILVVGVTPVSRKGGNLDLNQLELFAGSLKTKGFDVEFRHNILYETQGWKDDAPGKYDHIIVAVARTPHVPFGPLQLYDDEAQTVWAINAMPKEKIIVVNFGNPYLVNEYFERVNTCINAYSNTTMMHDAVISALLGKIKIFGTTPVELDIPSKFMVY